VGVFRTILIFIKTAFRPVGTAVAGARSAVSPRTLERGVFGAFQGALSAINTPAIIVTFQRHLTFVGKSTVQFDFFPDSGFVFADGLCNGGL